MECVNRRNPGLSEGALTLYMHGAVGKGFPWSPGEHGSAALPPPPAHSLGPFLYSLLVFICLQICSKVTFSLGSCLLV